MQNVESLNPEQIIGFLAPAKRSSLVAKPSRGVGLGAASHSFPFVVTLGGGYSNPIQLAAEAHANTFRTAAEVFA